MILPPHSALERPNLQYCIQFGASQLQKNETDINGVSPAQRHLDGQGAGIYDIQGETEGEILLNFMVTKIRRGFIAFCIA